ncbi:hypothetical protein [Streptomyces sp. NBC_01180]|uniref:hypothetical protein n=1 Tax=Streptomyces sp. NBC_01180 TaxID=2903763 RepID=UPI00386726D1
MPRPGRLRGGGQRLVRLRLVRLRLVRLLLLLRHGLLELRLLVRLLELRLLLRLLLIRLRKLLLLVRRGQLLLVRLLRYVRRLLLGRLGSAVLGPPGLAPRLATGRDRVLARDFRDPRTTPVGRQYDTFVRAPHSWKLRLVALSVLRHRDSYCTWTYGIVGSRYRVNRRVCHGAVDGGVRCNT